MENISTMWVDKNKVLKNNGNYGQYICKEEIHLDWENQEGGLYAHCNDDHTFLDMESMNIDLSNTARSKLLCDFKKEDFWNMKKEIQNWDYVEHKEQSKSDTNFTNFEPIIVIEKLPEHVIKKSLRNKENIHPKTKSHENDRNSIKNFCVRFCENCKKTVKSDLKPKSCCPKCNSALTYECKKCSKHAISYTGMLYHLKSTCQTEGHYYQCSGCPYKSAFKVRIKEHMKKLHKDLPASNIEIVATNNLQKDLKSTEIHVHKCPRCGKQFRQLHYLNNHLKACGDFKYQVNVIKKDMLQTESNSEDLLHHSDPTPDTLNVIRMAKLYCKKCDERTDLDNSVYSSKKCKNCNSNLLFECLKCEKQYSSAKGIVYHFKAKCAAREMFFCSKCDYQSPVKILLTVHYKTIHESESVECPKCKNVLKNKGCLYKHLEYCGKEPYLHCDKCPYKSNNPTIFRTHVKRHDYSDKKIKATCPKCSKQLKTRFSLQSHLNYCGKEPRFHCTLCSYKSHFRKGVREHMVRMHFRNVNKFPACPECGVTLKDKNCANSHLKFCGTSEPYFQCDYCHYISGNKSHLKRHILLMHSQNFNKLDDSDVDVEN